MKKTLLLLVLLLSAAALYAGGLRTAHIFSDGMVLQRETDAPLWGWADPGATVSVRASWMKNARSCRADADGFWRTSLDTRLCQSTGPYEVTVSSGKEKVVLKDVLVGEVWICSGQSNMEMPVSGFGFQGVNGAMEAVLDAPEYQERIHVFDIKSDTTHVLQRDLEAVWKPASPGVTARTSAVAYFFARRLTRGLDVPVGIVVNAWGGSRIEPWMDWDAVRSAGLTDAEMKEVEALREKSGWWPQSTATCWNGRMAPVAGYAAKGFLWYQGCSNIGQTCYDRLQAAMVRSWREAWGQGDLPFLYVLLAPYEHDDSNGRWRPFFVEQQLRTQELIPAAWAVSTETLGDNVTIHPARKQEVADMLYLRAMESVYGREAGMGIDLPRLRSVEFQEDGTAKVLLTNVWSNLGSISSRSVKGFELAGEDRQWHLADAEIHWDGQTIFVRCPEVPHPVAVRYAFRNYMDANLQTTMGIPVPPFRSDDWED